MAVFETLDLPILISRKILSDRHTVWISMAQSRLARDETQICETILARLRCESLAKKKMVKIESKLGKNDLFRVNFVVTINFISLNLVVFFG